MTDPAFAYNCASEHMGVPIMITGTAYGGKARITMQIEYEKEEFVVYSVSSQNELDAHCASVGNLAIKRVEAKKAAA